MGYRIEKDFLGTVEVDDDMYYGIHTLRSLQNFNVVDIRTHEEIINAYILIKKAAAYANMHCGLLEKVKGDAIVSACDRVLSKDFEKEFKESFITCAIQGGAGTSVNMNVNEVLANVALEILGHKKGDYEYINPIDHVNMSQSTNDTFLTAVKIAAIKCIRELSESFAKLQEALQLKENEFKDVVKVGRTQLQDAVPITLGQEFSAYAQAVARDRWRLYKCEERLRQISLGGTAIGTGINADMKYIFYITEKIRELTRIGLARSENMIDITQNTDVFVEVSGLLKTAAVNLTKIANDLRLLSSGPSAGIGEIRLPHLQAGSSIMPGKVNPVIPELVNQVAFEVMSNDMTIMLASSAGQLELNAMAPIMAHRFLDSIKIMCRVIPIFIERCINGIEANKERCEDLLNESYCMSAALVPFIGYELSSEIAKICVRDKKDIIEVANSLTNLTRDELNEIFEPYRMTTPGLRSKRGAGKVDKHE